MCFEIGPKIRMGFQNGVLRETTGEKQGFFRKNMPPFSETTQNDNFGGSNPFRRWVLKSDPKSAWVFKMGGWEKRPERNFIQPIFRKNIRHTSLITHKIVFLTNTMLCSGTVIRQPHTSNTSCNKSWHPTRKATRKREWIQPFGENARYESRPDIRNTWIWTKRVTKRGILVA